MSDDGPASGARLRSRYTAVVNALGYRERTGLDIYAEAVQREQLPESCTRGNGQRIERVELRLHSLGRSQEDHGLDFDERVRMSAYGLWRRGVFWDVLAYQSPAYSLL